ncbi:MAG: phosphoribosylformylglycinamidine cyclo-ligase, partial [Mesorhizobium sp.]
MRRARKGNSDEPDMTKRDTAKRKNGLTYAEAGVDIDAGNLM